MKSETSSAGTFEYDLVICVGWVVVVGMYVGARYVEWTWGFVMRVGVSERNEG